MDGAVRESIPTVHDFGLILEDGAKLTQHPGWSCTEYHLARGVQSVVKGAVPVSVVQCSAVQYRLSMVPFGIKICRCNKYGSGGSVSKTVKI